MPAMTGLEAEARALVRSLGGRWSISDAQGMACCPAHEDHHPSLRIKAGHVRLLFHCFAGCSREEVLSALLRSHLILGRPASSEHRPCARAPCALPSALALELWDSAGPITGSLGERYLQTRRLQGGSAELRYHPRLPLGPRRLGRRTPAMVAAIRDASGFLAIQRSYLMERDDGHVKLLERRVLGAMGQGAVRLAEAGSDLGLAEGIETALAATILSGVPCWATLGAGRLAKVGIPAGVKRLHLFVDHDERGLRAVEIAKVVHGRTCKILTHVPPSEGTDWNDVLLGTSPTRV